MAQDSYRNQILWKSGTIGTNRQFSCHFRLCKQGDLRGDLLPIVVLEVGVSGSRIQVGMSYPLFDEITRNAHRLKHRNPSMPEGVKPCLRKVESLQNDVQHPTCIPLTDGCSGLSFEDPSCSTPSQVFRQHPCQNRIDGDGTVALLCLDGDFFAFPDATADVDSPSRQIQVVNV